RQPPTLPTFPAPPHLFLPLAALSSMLMSVFLVIATPVFLALFLLWMDRLERAILHTPDETNQTGISEPLPTTPENDA
ncbi:hypothetical protein NQ050_10425, partial [Corynebacterium sp. 122RC1]|nr:hypothetical protein [Corynebacterium sp. 122RC1]